MYKRQNYAGGFLAIHFAHFTLATKQPAMTGPALAHRLDEANTDVYKRQGPAHRHHIAHEPAQQRVGLAQGGDQHLHDGHGKQGGERRSVEGQSHREVMRAGRRKRGYWNG